MKIKITKLDYHRNGVSGCGFWVVLFTWRDGKDFHEMVATVFPEPGCVAVLDTWELSNGNIEFGGGNSWRGDNFEPELREAIKSREEHFSNA